jgi:uncharacterized protein
LLINYNYNTSKKYKTRSSHYQYEREITMKNLSVSFIALFFLSSIAHASTINSKKEFEQIKSDLFKAIEMGDKKGTNKILEVTARKRIHRDILEAQDATGNTPLMQAIEKKNGAIASLLIDWRARLNTQNNNGETALIRAAALGCKNIVSDLLDANANVNSRTVEETTALHEVIKSNDLASILNAFRTDMSYKTYILGKISNWWHNWIYCDIATMLIEAHADVNIQDNNGTTPLMLAASLGQTEMAQKLIKAKADLNTQDQNGQTALITAAQEGYSDIVKVLLAAQADQKLVDADGKSALAYAKEANLAQIISLLKPNEKQS